MRVVQTAYTGEPNAICDRCGFQYKLSELRRSWDGLMVCPPDFDPKPDTLNPPRIVPEGLPVPNARPEPPLVFVDDVGPDDL